MKSWLIQLMICGGAAVAFAAAAIGQDAPDQSGQQQTSAQQAPAQQPEGQAQTSDAPAQQSEAVVATRPSNTESNLETLTSRPERTGFGNGQLESRQQQRRERRNQQRGGFGGTGLSSSSSSPQPLYEVVGARNIFIRGNQEPPQSFGSGGSGGLSAAEQALRDEKAQQADLMLTGVSLADNGKVALVENHSDYSYQRVQIGDPIAGGKVVNMTLDSLDYKNSAGQIIRVPIGYNLSGGDVWGVAGGSSSSTASTQPSAGGPRKPGESMEDYLKRRRGAELSH
jgi:hypothetical protein